MPKRSYLPNRILRDLANYNAHIFSGGTVSIFDSANKKRCFVAYPKLLPFAHELRFKDMIDGMLNVLLNAEFMKEQATQCAISTTSYRPESNVIEKSCLAGIRHRENVTCERGIKTRNQQFTG